MADTHRADEACSKLIVETIAERLVQLHDLWYTTHQSDLGCFARVEPKVANERYHYILICAKNSDQEVKIVTCDGPYNELDNYTTHLSDPKLIGTVEELTQKLLDHVTGKPARKP